MLTLLHGDNLVTSYQAYLKAFKTFEGATKQLVAKDLTLKTVAEILGQDSLFSDRLLILIEGWPKADLLKTIEVYGQNQDIIIWVDRKVDHPKIKAKVLEFKDSAGNNSFKFIDSFLAKKAPASLRELEALWVEKIPTELLVGMITRQLRLLIQVKDRDANGVNPYVYQKLQLIEKTWTREEILTTLEALLELDHQIKTGRIEARRGLLNFLTQILVK